jgi:hypothetical protein
MPSTSKKQQRLMGMAYSYAKGDIPDASDQVKDLAKSFMKKGKKRGLKKLKDFASTKHDNLKENMKIKSFNSFNESIKSKEEILNRIKLLEDNIFTKRWVMEHPDYKPTYQEKDISISRIAEMEEEIQRLKREYEKLKNSSD